MGYARKDVEKTKKIAKKFVRYQEGAELYSIGLTSDKILVLDDGELVATGTHKELYKTNEVYRDICLSQLSEKEVASV